MSESLHMTAGIDRRDDAIYTLQEIVQQPLLWPTTVARVRAASEQLNLTRLLSHTRVLLTGAGSSAYAASGVAPAWPGAIAVPTTDLLIDAERTTSEVALEAVLRFVQTQRLSRLNVAGPRASGDRRGHAYAHQLIRAVCLAVVASGR